MCLSICQMLSFTVITFFFANPINGARPGGGFIDWRSALEVNHEVSVRSVDPNGCPKLKEQLEALGLRGEGDPCQWRSIRCSSPCTATSIIVKDGQVSGDIGVLSDLTELRILRLCNTQVVGDISALRKLRSLQKLWLRDSHVTGDLTSIENLTKLQILDMYNTGVTGDVSAMQSLLGLRKVDLKNARVTGDIVAFQNLRKLRWLSLYGTQVVGDISALSKANDLLMLDLDHTYVTGDIKSLEGLTGLRKLWLINTRVEGDIMVLRNMKGLWNLDLQNTRVQGDVAAMQNLKGLWNIKLSNTNVEGHLAAMQDLKKLWKLSLRNTRMKGDVAAVQNLRNLEYLILDNTQVEGAVGSVQNLSKLAMLSLSNTRVDGDIAAVQNMTELVELLLSNTRVDGDIAAVKKLRRVKELNLADTKVSGDVSAMVQLTDLEHLNLAGTAVTGWITGDSWRGCCKKLREINVADAAVGPLPVLEGAPEFPTNKPLLPALQTLNVSGSRLNGSVADFLLPLAQTPLTAIAASGCELSGTIPDFTSVSLLKDDWLYAGVRTKIANSLQVLDLSDNSLSSLASLPAAVRLDLTRNQVMLTLNPSVLQRAVKGGVEVWLEGTKLRNPQDLQSLLQHELHLKQEFSTSSSSSGSSSSFACRDLTETTVRVTPHLFVPEVMCQCQPGFEGFGVTCSACPNNTYSPARNSPQCHQCPTNSTSKSPASSCQCVFGSMHQDQDGSPLSCKCPANEALVDTPAGYERCEFCHKMHLKCPVAGSNASTAQVVEGHGRLVAGSLEVFECLDPSRCKPGGCAPGYDGILCADCAAVHRSSHGQCQPCSEIQDMSAQRVAVVTLWCGGLLAFFGSAAWMIRRGWLADVGLRWKCAAKLLVPQLAILLQVMQLWSVLGQLSQTRDHFPSGNATDDAGILAEVEAPKSDLLLSYMEALQFTASELQGVFAMQCLFHGASVRLAFAVMTPVAPLVLLLSCCFIELFSPGAGIELGLQLLTLLFIGAASGTAQLLDCQRWDATGKASLGNFSFRPLMPHLLCTEATWVDWLGYGCAIFYGVVIPSFLAFLFAKQHVVMRQSKTFMVCADGDAKEVTMQLHVLSNKDCLKEDVKQKRLIAAAAAYVAVNVKNCALVELKDAAVTVHIKQDGESAADIFDAVFTVDALVQSEDAAATRNRAEILRYNAMVQMLAERTVLADIKSNRQDRIMMGAKGLLGKYVNCGFVWLEACLKLASATLVSVVGSKDGFWLSVAITLGMALVVGLAQPFMQPQLNALQTCCFVCLSMAALGFHVHRVWWLSRVALALPVLLLVLLLVRPDSKEALALRLQEELEKKLPEGPVEVSAKQVRFI